MLAGRQARSIELLHSLSPAQARPDVCNDDLREFSLIFAGRSDRSIINPSWPTNAKRVGIGDTWGMRYVAQDASRDEENRLFTFSKAVTGPKWSMLMLFKPVSTSNAMPVQCNTEASGSRLVRILLNYSGNAGRIQFLVGSGGGGWSDDWRTFSTWDTSTWKWLWAQHEYGSHKSIRLYDLDGRFREEQTYTYVDLGMGATGTSVGFNPNGDAPLAAVFYSQYHIPDESVMLRVMRNPMRLFRAPPVVFVPSGAGAPSVLGLASETDSAFSVSGAKQAAAGLATETDVAQALAAAKTVIVGLASETDSAFAVSALKVAAAGLAAWRPFFGSRRAGAVSAHEAPPALWVGPVLLAGVSVAFGLAPDRLVVPLVEPAAGAIRGERTELVLGSWLGVSASLVQALLMLVAGAALYRLHDSALRLLAPFGWLGGWGPPRAYDALMAGIPAVATAQTRVLQHGVLGWYLVVTIATAVGVGAYALLTRGAPLTWALEPIRAAEAAVALTMIGGAVAVVRAQSLLVAIAALGSVGYGLAMVFLLFGGPDLALTQFAIETLAVLLFVLALRRLPQFRPLSSRAERRWEGALAVAGGVFVTALVLAATAAPHPTPLRDYFAEASLALAKGRNVVNVILVDFRAFDTLGEIVVLAAAALGVMALLRAPGGVPHAGGPLAVDAPVLRVAARLLVPLFLLFSVFLFVRGHNLPGGGFVGGLVGASAFALVLLSEGLAAARRLLRVEPETLVAGGLAAALISALPSALAGMPLLTGLWAETPLPVLGKPGTPLLFDAGVYLVVLGIVVAILFALAEEEA